MCGFIDCRALLWMLNFGWVSPTLNNVKCFVVHLADVEAVVMSAHTFYKLSSLQIKHLDRYPYLYHEY